MTASFIGHRHIRSENSLLQIIHREIYTLIARKGVDTFLFGSRSQFDDICLKIVSDMKTEFPHIKRIYVRAEYPVISKSYTDYLLRIYDGTYFPSEILDAGKAIYVERNRIMIDNSDFCIFYYDKTRADDKFSGTRLAYKYALSQNKNILNLCPNDFQ